MMRKILPLHCWKAGGLWLSSVVWAWLFGFWYLFASNRYVNLDCAPTAWLLSLVWGGLSVLTPSTYWSVAFQAVQPPTFPFFAFPPCSSLHSVPLIPSPPRGIPEGSFLHHWLVKFNLSPSPWGECHTFSVISESFPQFPQLRPGCPLTCLTCALGCPVNPLCSTSMKPKLPLFIPNQAILFVFFSLAICIIVMGTDFEISFLLRLFWSTSFAFLIPSSLYLLCSVSASLIVDWWLLEPQWFRKVYVLPTLPLCQGWLGSCYFISWDLGWWDSHHLNCGVSLWGARVWGLRLLPSHFCFHSID